MLPSPQQLIHGNADGTVRTQVKPAVDAIIRAGSIDAQAAHVRAVADLNLQRVRYVAKLRWYKRLEVLRPCSQTEADKKEAQKSIRSVLNAFEACMSLIVHEGKVGAVGMTNEEAAGYCLVKSLSEPYTLHADREGMSGIISAEKMVVDALYFNLVQRAQNWYTPSAIMMVVEVKHILWTGL